MGRTVTGVAPWSTVAHTLREMTANTPGYTHMLDSIRLIDFKNHADTRIGLRELTLLVGPNGAGKSGVLQALQLTSRIFQQGAKFKPLESDTKPIVIRRGATRALIQLIWQGPGIGPDSCSRLDLTIDSNEAEFERFEFFRGREEVVRGSHTHLRSGAGTIRDELGRAILLRLSALRLAEPSFLESTAATIASDGYGLASVIAHLMTFERDRFDEFESALCSIIPAVKRIRVRRVQKTVRRPGRDPQQVIADELVLDMSSGDALPPAALSEGTLIVLGLLAVLVGPDCPSLVLIDDIDQALHPRAQSQLVTLLRALIKARPGLQIIATSHSPYLIDALDPGEVWVLAARPDGIAAAACLAEHPDAERFQDVLRTGEFLSAVGEDWVLNLEGPDADRTDR